MTNKFSRVLITGASGGIGSALASAIDAQGVDHIVLTGRENLRQRSSPRQAREREAPKLPHTMALRHHFGDQIVFVHVGKRHVRASNRVTSVYL